MAKAQSTTLTVEPRASAHSRATRRLRRAGRVPGVLYGRGADPQPFSVDERDLRLALAAAGAVLDVELDGSKTSAILKDSHRHPVRGEVLHIDLLRVDLNKPIQAQVVLHLVGADDAPGVKEGGVLEQVTREITVEALPNDIPETIEHDVSHMEMLATEHLSAVTAPPNVTFTDDLEETVIASVTPPRVEEVDDEIEAETGIVGEEGAPVAEGEGEAGGAEGAAEDAGAGGDE
ncbi:MAG: large subunit ribosomal protein [Solirubrobacteraceae bacterium]|nr:large subunit ribosomal protein [Solirubrobacteraceae bacterium]